MIQRAILLGALLAAAVCAAADVGDLTYVACDPKEAVDASTLYRQGRSSAAPPKNSGIVNPQAAVLQFTGVSLRIRVAIDSAKPDVRVPDLVRFDFSGAGRFKDADVVALVRTRTSARGTLYTGKFGPKVLHVKHGGRAIPVTVQGDYHKSGTYRRISLSLGAAVQGTCAFGKKTHAVRIIDGNHNLSFGDPPKSQAGREQDRALREGRHPGHRHRRRDVQEGGPQVFLRPAGPRGRGVVPSEGLA